MVKLLSEIVTPCTRQWEDRKWKGLDSAPFLGSEVLKSFMEIGHEGLHSHLWKGRTSVLYSRGHRPGSLHNGWILIVPLPPSSIEQLHGLFLALAGASKQGSRSKYIRLALGLFLSQEFPKLLQLAFPCLLPYPSHASLILLFRGIGMLLCFPCVLYVILVFAHMQGNFHIKRS